MADNPNTSEACRKTGGHPAFDEFVDTIAALRTPVTGCPWDLEQTHQSIAPNMIEEAFETVDAIEQNDISHMREELGDVLLQVVLQSQIAADEGEFTIDDVCRDVNDKIVRRHPHVFGDIEAGSANEVIVLWDKIKLQEKANSAADSRSDAGKAPGEGSEGAYGADEATAPSDAGAVGTDESAPDTGEVDADAAAPDAGAVDADGTASDTGAAGSESVDGIRPKGLLDGVPSSFPALMQAQKISRKAVAAGFEWESIDDVWRQVEEEIGEFKSAYSDAPKDDRGVLLHDTPEFSEAELEFGDILFSLVNVARKCGIDSERALRATCRKFRRRWAHMEAAAHGQGRGIEDLSTAELETLWQDSKSS